MMFETLKLGAFALFCISGGSVSAAPILLYDFVAESSEGGVATGFFSYDVMQPDLDPIVGLGQYIGSFEVSVAGGALNGGFQSVSDADIFVNDSQGFLVYPSGIGVPAHFVQFAEFGLNLGEILPNPLQFGSLPALSNVALQSDQIGLIGPSNQVFYEVRTLELRDTLSSPVPLPAALPLLLTGLIGVVALNGAARKT